MITHEQIKKFQNLYRKRFGKKIDTDQACEQGIKLMRLVELIYQPITEQEYNKLNEQV